MCHPDILLQGSESGVCLRGPLVSSLPFRELSQRFGDVGKSSDESPKGGTQPEKASELVFVPWLRITLLSLQLLRVCCHSFR